MVPVLSVVTAGFVSGHKPNNKDMNILHPYFDMNDETILHVTQNAPLLNYEHKLTKPRIKICTFKREFINAFPQYRPHPFLSKELLLIALKEMFVLGLECPSFNLQ